MKTMYYVASVVGLCIFWTGFALAETYTINGKITKVEEIWQTHTIQTPEQTCQIIDVPIYGNVGEGASAGDVITGAIIGGIIGNNIKGEKGGGAAGAVIGGILGAEKNKNKQGIVGYKKENQCTTTYRSVQSQELAGYKIYYNVHGMRGVVNRSSTVRPKRGDSIPVTVHINAR